MAQVFISYARRDGRPLADRLARDLEALDHRPWLDRSEIWGGADWSRAIESAIDDCDVFLAVLTAGSFASSICRGEQARALRVGKPVVPLLGQADADRPVYLETAHYIDFSAPDLFSSSLAALADRIHAGEGLRVQDLPVSMRDIVTVERPLESMAAAFGRRSATWSEVCALASTNRRQFLDVVGSRARRTGVYDPELYVPRPGAERELERFLASDAAGLVLLGNSGVGKTSLLCDWAGRMEDEGHATLMYHAAKLRSSDVATELIRDLRLEDATDVPGALSVIDDLARSEERQLIIVIDGVNEFRGRSEEGIRELLEDTDVLIADLPGTHVRVVVSSSTPAWTRVDRAGDVKLSWGRYHVTLDDDEVLMLGAFTEEEAESAYSLYRSRFGLGAARHDLPAALRARLRDPLLLRFFAVAGADTASETLTDAHIFRRYFQDRVKRSEDRRFLDSLVAEMRRVGQPGLSVLQLAEHERVGQEVRTRNPESSYMRLLDDGVLVEMEGGDPLFDDVVVRFAYPMVGAYALARIELRVERPIADTVRELVDLSARVPFAWDAAETVLTEHAPDSVFVSLAQSEDVELREVAIEALTSLSATDEDRSRSILDELLRSESSIGQRSALRAAYAIGPASRDLFVSAATSSSESLRQAVRDTLYLIWTGTTRAGRSASASDAYFLWRHSPDFTYGLVRELVSRVSWLRPRETYRIWRFVLDLLITIYINHCDRKDVTEHTAEIFRALTVDRLHLDRLRLGSGVERATLRVVSGVFSDRVLSWMLVGDGEEPARFFELPASDRAPLAELAYLLDPATDLAEGEDLVRGALGSDIEVLAGSGAVALAIHAHADFEGTEPVLRRLFESLDHRGRLWELLGLSVLLPTTPGEWVPLLEDFTSALIEADPTLRHDELGLLRSFDLFLVPLGLAYGKRGGAMPMIEDLVERGLSSRNASDLARLVVLLGPVGFYYPKATLTTLRGYADGLMGEPELVEALATALGTMRTLHTDLVDSFLLRLPESDRLRRRIALGGDAQQIQRFVHLLGYYNNAVHYCLHYPRMRRDLGMFALTLLAEAKDANHFVVEYSRQALRMAREADFDLVQWTLP